MRKILAMCGLLMLGGCANAYATYFSPIDNPNIIKEARKKPDVIYGSGSPQDVVYQMYMAGYGIVGSSSFNGPEAPAVLARMEAENIGASRVVIISKYESTRSGVAPLSMPTSQTSYVNGTARTQGSVDYTTPFAATTNVQATVTTYGTQTMLIPYSVDRYNQVALYFSPMKRRGFGVMPVSLTADEMRLYQTVNAYKIAAVYPGSPAAAAGFVPGDVVEYVDGMAAANTPQFKQHFEACFGRPCVVKINRGGAEKELTINVPPSGYW
jgi:hypothetical protein